MYEAYEADESYVLHELRELHELRKAYEAWLAMSSDQKKLIKKSVFLIVNSGLINDMAYEMKC